LAQDNKLIRSLIESSRNGNYNAFEQLFKMHVGYVYAISIRLLSDFEDANENISKIFKESELVQDTDLKSNDRKSKREKKHFSFKDLFKKKE
jgi:hypothetical protein